MSEHWSERPEGGGRFAIGLLCAISLRLGRPFARALLYPITLYFYWRRPFEREGSRAFLTRALGRPASAREVLRHIHRFAATLLDRVFLLQDRYARFDVRINGLDDLIARIEPQRGVLLLGAHVGSYEVLRVAAAERPDVKVRVVLDTQQTPALTELMHAINPHIGATVIDATRSATDIVLALGEAIQDGAVTALLADRARPGESTVEVDFFGAPAAFPIAPFVIGAVLKAPVMLCFGLYRGGNRYDLHFETFAEELVLPRRDRETQVRALVQRYATRLEHHMRNDPYNWFNWHDFWSRDNAENATDAAGQPLVDRRRVSRAAVSRDAASA